MVADDEHIGVEACERLEDVSAVAEVAGVAMEEEDGGTGARRAQVPRDELRTVSGGEGDLFGARHTPVAVPLLVRTAGKEDEAVAEGHAHDCQ